jgi:uncharacterized protein (TIGR02231 family)
MKKHSGLIGWSLILLGFANSNAVLAQKAEIEPATKTQKVIVFTDRAMITKEAILSVKKGENTIRISGLTPFLINESVQVSTIGQSDIGIADVAVEETFLKKTDQPGVKKLQADLNEVNRQIKDATYQVSVINNSNDFLKKVDPFPQNQKVTQAEIEAHAKFLEKSFSTNFGRIEVIEIKIKKLNDEKIDLESELAKVSTDKRKSKTIIIHLLAGNEKSELKLGFSYVSIQAGWEPQYEAKADINTSKIKFNYLASIWQSTGEDWTDANIEISTAKPFIYGSLPDLTAWYLDIYSPRPMYTKSISALQQLSGLSMSKEEEQPVENSFKQTEIKEENTSFSFVLPNKVDINSDGQPHHFSIAHADAEAKFAWFTVPKLVQNAFLKASMKNPFTFPLLVGPMSVFFDQKLVGTASVNETILPEGEMGISLGIDEGVKIERKLQKKLTDYAGLLSKETKVHYEYTIEITNGKSKEINLDLNDQFPMSRNEKIKVEIEAPKGSEAEVSDQGIIKWKLKLAPGAKRSIPVKFTVSYPKDLSISGLQ